MENKDTYTCRVCGYEMPKQGSARPGQHYTCIVINDAVRSVADLCEEWIDDGMKRWLNPDNPPKDWNPEKQLEKVTKRF